MDDITEKIQALLNDEESMRQIKELAEMFGGGGEAASQQENISSAPPENNDDISGGLFGSIDPFMIMELIGAFSRSDPNCELITALRPLLSEDKQQKADRAVKMLRLYNVYTAMKEQGILNDLL